QITRLLGSLPIVRMIEGERDDEPSVPIPLESTAEPHSRRPRRSGVWSPDALVPAQSTTPSAPAVPAACARAKMSASGYAALVKGLP
ncbi:MAG: hypothetical protein ACREXR_17800, partial [Gammaproteobacteria bacterium]